MIWEWFIFIHYLREIQIYRRKYKTEYFKKLYLNYHNNQFKIVPDNPITNSIKVLIGVTAGRVVGNVLLGVFTLGIGNAIAESIII